jgi:hypothetical protein
MPPDRSDRWGGNDLRRGILLSSPLLAWPFLVHQGTAFLFCTYLLVLVPIILARTATELIVVLFVYFGVDGYLRLLFEYSWGIYQLPLAATLLVYLRWFSVQRPKDTGFSLTRNPIAIPLLGLAGLYAIEMFNGVPWDPLVSVGGFAYHLGTVPLFFIAANGFRDERKVRGILWFIVGLALFECLYALAQYYLGPPELLALSQHYQARMASEAWWVPGTTDLVYRPTGLTIGAGGPAMYGVVGIVLALGLLQGSRSSLSLKTAVLLGVFAMLVAVFLSAVRAFWLGLLLALLVFGLLRSVRYVTLIGGLGWAAAALAISLTHGALYARLSTLLTPWTVFYQERGADILQLPRIVSQTPMGIGLGRVAGSAAGQARGLLPEGVYGGAHNYWVSITWEASLLAPILLGWLLWLLFKSGFSVFRQAKDLGSRSVVAAILALDLGIVAMTFAGPVLAGLASSFAQYFWFLSGLVFATHLASANAPAPSSSTASMTSAR